MSNLVAFYYELQIIRLNILSMHTVNTDGGSRWNPGPSGCAFVIADRGKVMEVGKFYLGTMTNNQAEYLWALLWLQAAQKRGISEIHLIMDSELVIRQLQWIYKVKEPTLKILHKEIKDILAGFQKVQFSSVLRERNTLADELANQAMDDRLPLYTHQKSSEQPSFFE